MARCVPNVVTVTEALPRHFFLTTTTTINDHDHQPTATTSTPCHPVPVPTTRPRAAATYPPIRPSESEDRPTRATRRASTRRNVRRTPTTCPHSPKQRRRRREEQKRGRREGGRRRRGRKRGAYPIHVDHPPSITPMGPDYRKTSADKAAEDASQPSPTKLTP